jgi:hypothetical protein
MSPAYNGNTTGIGVRYALPRVPFYSFGSFRMGAVTDPLPAAVVGVETGETGPTTSTAGLQTAINLMTSGISQKDATLAFILRYPIAPGAISVSLQVSDRDVDADYVTVAGSTSTKTAGDYLEFTGIQANFARAIVTSATGTYSIVAIILVK